MIFDSLAALLLFAACVSAWALAGGGRAAFRVNIRFAAMLLAALSAARLGGLWLQQFSVLAIAVALIVAPLASMLVTLSLFGFLARPVPAGAASLALGLSLGAGLAGALSGAPVYALVCQIIGVGLTLAAGLSAFAAGMQRASLSLLAALSLLGGGFALMAGALNVTELFFAAALIAATSQTRVEAQGEQQALAAIHRRG